MKKAFFSIAVIALAILAGCEKKSHQSEYSDKSKENSASAPPSPPPKPPYSDKDWRRDFSSAFEASRVESDGDGVSSYKACFDIDGDKCKLSMSGKRDGFRKVDHLISAMTAFQEYYVKYGHKGKTAAFVDLRVVARQCDQAVVVINPTINAKKWLFMDKVGFMADGEVVYEQVADYQAVKRNIEDGRVWESWSFKLKTEDYEKILHFSSAKVKVIRLSGEKGYFTIDNDSVDIFAKDVQENIRAATIINNALVKGGGPFCASL